MPKPRHHLDIDFLQYKSKHELIEYTDSLPRGETVVTQDARSRLDCFYHALDAWALFEKERKDFERRAAVMKIVVNRADPWIHVRYAKEMAAEEVPGKVEVHSISSVPLAQTARTVHAAAAPSRPTTRAFSQNIQRNEERAHKKVRSSGLNPSLMIPSKRLRSDRSRSPSPVRPSKRRETGSNIDRPNGALNEAESTNLKPKSDKSRTNEMNLGQSRRSVRLEARGRPRSGSAALGRRSTRQRRGATISPRDGSSKATQHRNEKIEGGVPRSNENDLGELAFRRRSARLKEYQEARKPRGMSKKSRRHGENSSGVKSQEMLSDGFAVGV